MRKPYLIQRMKVRTEPKTPATVTNSFELDYMGAAEFEFGALPKSLRRFETKLSNCLVQTVYVKGKPVYLFCTEEDAIEYLSWLEQMSGSRYDLPLKEYNQFSELINNRPIASYDDNDTFWDISNEVIFSLKKENIDLFSKAVVVSLEVMNRG